MKHKLILQWMLLTVLTVGLAAQTVETVVPTSAGLSEPYNVVADPNDPAGVYYISDSANNRILVFRKGDSGPSLLAGDPAGEPGDADGEADAARFFSPQGMVFVENRSGLGDGLIVADSANNLIRFVSTVNGTVTTLAGRRGQTGSDNGAGTDATFNFPIGLALASDGKVFIADSRNNAIRILDTDAANTVSTRVTGLTQPSAVELDAAGRIFVTEHRRHVIKMIDGAAAPEIIAGAEGVVGSLDATVGTSATFNGPRALLFLGGASGMLVSDSGNHTIRQLIRRTDGKYAVFRFAGATGTGALVDGNAATAQFNSPLGLSLDADGLILVADLFNNAVRAIRRSPAPDPIASVESGVYSEPISIVLTNHTQSSFFRFTLDGSLPTRGSDLYTAPINVSEGTGTSATTILQVRAFSPDAIGSGVLSNRYTFALRTPGVSPGGGSFTNVPMVTLTNTVTGAEYFYTQDGSDPARTNGTLWAGTSFALTNQTLKVKGFRARMLDTATLTQPFSLTVATPKITPGGGTFVNSTPVEISNMISGATYLYTIDGSDPAIIPSPNPITDPNPTTNGVVYTGQFTLGTSGTLKVRGIRPGFDDSDISSAQFNLIVSDAKIVPEGGAFTGAPRVRFDNTLASATYLWTIDGTDPSILPPLNPLVDPNPRTNGTVYAGEFVLPRSGTLKVIGIKAGLESSAIVGATFQLTVPTPKIVPDGGSFTNSPLVVFTNMVADATYVWTSDGTDPSITPSPNPVVDPDPVVNGNVINGATGFSFNLGTNGVVKIKGIKSGFSDSPIVSASFALTAPTPIIAPAGGTFTNTPSVSISNFAAGDTVVYTTDGTDPSITPSPNPNENPNPVINGTTYTAPFSLTTFGIVKARTFRNGFEASAIASEAFRLNVDDPNITPQTNRFINLAPLTISTRTTGAALLYTLDGTDPVTSSTRSSGTSPLSLNVGTNATLRVVGNLSGFTNSAVITKEFRVQVDTPTLSPSGGFFPSRVELTFANLNLASTIFYTLDGSEPTTNSTRYMRGDKIRLDQTSFPGGDLRNVKARAFADGLDPSEIASGAISENDEIGFIQDINAGIGSTVVIPVIANLKSNQVLRSLQFNVQLAPSAAGTPNVGASQLRALNSGPNDFVRILDGTESQGTSTFSTSQFQIPGAGGVQTNVLAISFIGTNANFAVRNFAAITLLSVTIPTTSTVGQSYTIQVTQPSGTSDGQQQSVSLAAMAPRTILVTNVSYLVGDTAPGGWYNVGDFGDNKLDNSDVNNAFYASLGVRVPFNFTDVFDAMDVYPEDSVGSVGGDGQIRFLDWQRVLRRALRRDTSNWSRIWSAGGSRIPTAVALGAFASVAESATAKPGAVWVRDALLSASPVPNVAAGATVRVPVTVKTYAARSISGLQFRGIVSAVNGAPDLQKAAKFVAAPGLQTPAPVDGLALNQVAAGWNLESFAPSIEGEQLLGHIEFSVPEIAGAGASYRVHFENVDGAPAPDAAGTFSQYEMESTAALVAVGGNGRSETISDEWRVQFFGSANSMLAETTADPDGDGAVNLQEYLAGTDPSDANSKLQLLTPQWRTEGGQTRLALQWLSAPGKSYTIEGASALGGNWDVLASGIAGDGLLKELVTTAPGQMFFFRIRLQQ
ncbi:MAG: chitobiase/beta-hexosaminidase C-terminal domain-containing protein [Verrucomicrobiota bacterium]